jgi:hypothetical protein
MQAKRVILSPNLPRLAASVPAPARMPDPKRPRLRAELVLIGPFMQEGAMIAARYISLLRALDSWKYDRSL